MKKFWYIIAAIVYVGIGIWGYQQIPVDLHYSHYMWPIAFGIMLFSFNGAGENPFKFAGSIFSTLVVIILPSISWLNGVLDKSQTFGWVYFISSIYATGTVVYLGIVMSPLTYIMAIRNRTNEFNEIKDSHMAGFKRENMFSSFNSRYYKLYVQEVNENYFDISPLSIYTNFVAWPVDIIKVMILDNSEGLLFAMGKVRDLIFFPSDFIKKKVRGF